MKLRDYQHRCVEANLTAFDEHRTVLNVMPTGTGKTITFAETIARFSLAKGVRAMVVAHREELIRQAVQKIKAVCNVEAEVEMAEYRADEPHMYHRSPVIVSTVQTQNSGQNPRMRKFDPYEFNLLIVDEAHHATSPSYRSIIEHYQENPDARVLGVTATPDRHDEAALGRVFDTCAFDYGLLDAISDGWLVDIHQQLVEVEGLDFSACNTIAGDFNQGDLDKAIKHESVMHGCIIPLLEIAGNRKTLLFCTTVATAERMVEIINRYRKRSVAFIIHAGTPRDERRELLDQYRAGEFRVMVNVGIATEGFDEPGIEVVAIARPTKSRSLYAQMIGRGTRPAQECVEYLGDCKLAASRRTIIQTSSKPSLLVVDFTGNSGTHKLVCTADILGGDYSDEVIAQARATVMAAPGAACMTEELRIAADEVEKQRKLRRNVILAKAKWSSRVVNPFDVFELAPHRERGWEQGKRPTDRMLRVLEKAKISGIDELTRAEAGRLVGELVRRWNNHLCSYAQAKLLRKFGESPECTMKEASAKIDAIAKNGWRAVRNVDVMA